MPEEETDLSFADFSVPGWPNTALPDSDADDQVANYAEYLARSAIGRSERARWVIAHTD